MRARNSLTIRYVPAPVPGPVFYPAGVWSALSTYERTSSACPFVLLDTGNPDTDLYYYLAKPVKIAGNAGNKTPAADYAQNGANATWKPVENIGYVFAKLVMANFGLIAGAVFSGNKLFSQFGKLGQADSTEYQRLRTNPDGTVAPSGFVPNVLIDWLRGYASILKGDIGPFKIDKSELTNSDYNAGISMRSADGSYVKVGDSKVSFFESAKVSVSDLTGNASGIYANVRKSPDPDNLFFTDNKALNVIGQSQLRGRNHTEHTQVSGSCNTPQLLGSFWFNYPPMAYSENAVWWDTFIYSFVNPLSGATRVSEGVYRFTHNLYRRPEAGKPVMPGQHVTAFFVKAYPVYGGGGGQLYAAASDITETTFTIRTADDSSPNDFSTMMVEVYNITHMVEFAKCRKKLTT